MGILIAVPTYETIAPECFKAIYDLEGDDLSFDFVKGYDCAKARNEIARKALEGGFEYVLMVDSDIILPTNTVPLLTESPVDVCFGVYPRKNTKTGETELFKDDAFDFVNRYTLKELDDIGQSRISVKGGGCGCVLIRTGIFNIIPYPWFEFLSYENNTFLSEDLTFSMRASAMFRLMADTRVRCGHIGRHIQYE